MSYFVVVWLNDNPDIIKAHADTVLKNNKNENPKRLTTNFAAAVWCTEDLDATGNFND